MTGKKLNEILVIAANNIDANHDGLIDNPNDEGGQPPAGEIIYKKGAETGRIVCLFGFCEVLPDRVHIMAESGERVDEIDVARAENAKTRAADCM